MKENIIKFLYPRGSFKLFEDNFPIPAKLNIPTWFKNLKTQKEYATIKSCIPFLDSLTAGYILKMPQDFYVKHNIKNKDNRLDSSYRFAINDLMQHQLSTYGLNLNTSQCKDTHSPEQLGSECPFNKKNQNHPFYKILNPFIIKTPPGYSCLFTAPLNNRDDRFEAISGIVDTDIYDNHINFPIILNGDKYPSLETNIERGTPYVQIIPFKRDDWKMAVEEMHSPMFLERVNIVRKLWNNYKTFFWKKKKWN